MDLTTKTNVLYRAAAYTAHAVREVGAHVKRNACTYAVAAAVAVLPYAVGCAGSSKTGISTVAKGMVGAKGSNEVNWQIGKPGQVAPHDNPADQMHQTATDGNFTAND